MARLSRRAQDGTVSSHRGQVQSPEGTQVRIEVLASGSAANCTLVESRDTRILVDCGLTLKETFSRLADIGVSPESLSGLSVSHLHIDHLRGAAKIAERLRIPIYMTHEEIAHVDWGTSAPEFYAFKAGAQFSIGDIDIMSFGVPHDSPAPVGYVMQDSDGKTLTYAMDLGSITEEIAEYLRFGETLFLEANHFGPMVAAGPYPKELQRRICGPLGHLSNEAVSDFLKTLTSNTKRVILGHLSRGNNRKELVSAMAEAALEEAGVTPILEVV